MKQGVQNYTWVVSQLNANKDLTIDKNCNGWTLINTGTQIARLNNGIVLYPGTPGTNTGESFAFGGNAGEIFSGRITVQFDAGGTPAATFIQKVYTENRS